MEVPYARELAKSETSRWSFDGRIGRGTFWARLFVLGLSGFFFAFLSFLIPRVLIIPIAIAYSIGALWYLLATQVKRLHDLGHSGWWVPITCIATPFSSIYLGFFKGTQGPNQYGLDPLTITWNVKPEAPVVPAEAPAAAPESASTLIHPSRIPNRWIQLIAGIIAMMAIANLQYAWTLFTKPIQAHLHVTLVAVQWTFTVFIALETWLVPFEGYLVDRIGPRFMLGLGSIMVALGWIGSGRAETITSLYFWYGVGGIGAGIVYGGTIGNALKWFPDHRGLCVGLTAGAYGVGTATTIAPIDAMLKSSGYQHTFIVWGIIQGIVVLAAALFLARPPMGWTPPNWKEKAVKIKARVNTSAVDMTPGRMLDQPSFCVIYLMMTMLAFGGLVVTAQLNPMASSYHVDNVIVAFGMTALVLAITVDRLLNGLTRPFWGWVSDNIGRENAIFVAFVLEAIAVYALLQLITYPVWFVVLSGLCFFAWGNIFSLFPSLTGDLYGSKWATTNYGIVYTAKGVAAAFAGPGAAWMFAKTGSWTKVFWAMIVCDLAAAFMALLWLKPLAARVVKDSERGLHVPVLPKADSVQTAV